MNNNTGFGFSEGRRNTDLYFSRDDGYLFIPPIHPMDVVRADRGSKHIQDNITVERMGNLKHGI